MNNNWFKLKKTELNNLFKTDKKIKIGLAITLFLCFLGETYYGFAPASEKVTVEVYSTGWDEKEEQRLNEKAIARSTHHNATAKLIKENDETYVLLGISFSGGFGNIEKISVKTAGEKVFVENDGLRIVDSGRIQLAVTSYYSYKISVNDKVQEVELTTVRHIKPGLSKNIFSMKNIPQNQQNN